MGIGWTFDHFRTKCRQTATALVGFMRFGLSLIASLIALLPFEVSASEDAAKALRAAEARGLRGVSTARLMTMLTDPALEAAGTHEGLKFTRDWIDSQPVASGDAHWQCLSEALYFEARG